jgi:hypothetical protein
MAVHARGLVFHDVFSARPALRRSFEHSVGQRACARPNDGAPPDRGGNSDGSQNDKTQYKNKKYLNESLHQNLD